MSRTSGRAQYRPNPITQGDQAAEEREAYASKVQRDDANALQQGATRSLVNAATKAGYNLQPGAGSSGQSAANRADIARSVVAQNNGNHMAPNTPQMTATHMPSNAVGDKSAAQVNADAATLKDFQASAPKKTAPAALANAAGTGKTVSTPYGTGSSTTSTTVPVKDPTADQSTGPKNLNWQQEIVKKYPAIGAPGSQANADFVAAWKKAKATAPDGTDPDHHAIADQVMKNITTPANTAQKAITPQASPEKPWNFTPVTPPTPTTEFAGQTIPANPGAPIRSPEAQDAAQTAQSAQNAGATVAQYAAAPFVQGHDAAIAVGNAVSNAFGKHVLPFFKGFTGGGTPPTPATPPATPDASTPTNDRYASGSPGAAFNPQPLTLGPSPSTPSTNQTASTPSYSPPPTPDQPKPITPNGSYSGY